MILVFSYNLVNSSILFCQYVFMLQYYFTLSATICDYILLDFDREQIMASKLSKSMQKNKFSLG